MSQKGKIPYFILSDNEISPLLFISLQKFRGSKSDALVCTQFLCTLNIQLGVDLKIPEDAMSEFYRNLSIQVLSKSNHKIRVDFTKISDLVKNINYNLQNETYDFWKINDEAKQNAFNFINNWRCNNWR